MTPLGQYVLSVFFGLTTIVGCILNSLIILAVLSKRQLRGRKANLYLCSLCLSDMLTCLYSVPYHLIHLHPEIYLSLLSLQYCRCTQFFIYVLAFSSTLCLTGVCVDRYIAIARPFLYLTDRFSRISVLLLLWPWLQAICTSVPAIAMPIISVQNYTGFPCAINSSRGTAEVWFALTLTNIILPFICIFVSSIVVFRVARRQLHQIQLKMPTTLGDQSEDRSSACTIKSGLGNDFLAKSLRRGTKDCQKLEKDGARRKFNRNFREEAKITFATIVVVLGFLIAWTPYFVTRLLYLLGVHLSDDVYLFGTAFVLANSSWNPALIIALRGDIKKSVNLLCNRFSM